MTGHWEIIRAQNRLWNGFPEKYAKIEEFSGRKVIRGELTKTDDFSGHRDFGPRQMKQQLIIYTSAAQLLQIAASTKTSFLWMNSPYLWARSFHHFGTSSGRHCASLCWEPELHTYSQPS